MTVSDNVEIAPPAASEPVTITPLPIRERWLNNALDVAAAPSESGTIAAVREAAIGPARAAQLPGRKDEAWRQTDFSSLLATQMISAVEPPSAALIEEFVEGEAPGMRMVVVDGLFSAELSDLSALPEGVHAGSLASLESSAQSAALPLLQALPEDGQDKRTALGCYTWAAINQASLADPNPPDPNPNPNPNPNPIPNPDPNPNPNPDPNPNPNPNPYPNPNPNQVDDLEAAFEQMSAALVDDLQRALD